MAPLMCVNTKIKLLIQMINFAANCRFSVLERMN